jgi:hypothetical protein
MSLECGRSSINLDPAFPAGLLAPRERNTMLTSLAGAEPAPTTR